MMQSRSDQIKAQSALHSRLTCALVAADPDALEHPHRRTVVGTVAGLLIGCLVVVGFAVYGYFVPGGSSAWRQPRVLIVERETGSRYLYVDGELRPVLNYASARLLLGPAPKVQTVSRRSLAEARHGQPIGIVGAPDALPTVPLRALSWTLCAEQTVDEAGAARTGNVLSVTADRSGAALPADRAIVATTRTGTHLVWSGRRFALRQPWLVKVLGYEGLAVAVTAPWLDVVPAGPDVDSIDVTGRGQPGPNLDGRPSRFGQVFVVRNTGTTERYYLLRADGLSPLTATGAAIVLGDPATAAAYPGQSPAALPLSPAALATTTTTSAPAVLAALPAQPPAVAAVAGGQVPCVRLPSPSGPPEAPVEVLTTAPDPDARPVRPAPDMTGLRGDVRVRIDAGGGGLVTVARAGQPSGASLHLLTDAGVGYPVAGAAVAKSLGFPEATAVAVPSALLELLPAGPVLDPARVRG
ncbi:type VII secretion protein EccB [Dactylosporangium sp. NBC_01737]|uniref:type VII secretion protein EccB n=1 Tax=Dactylosporangium sp. NBC_01737 TaxID=2975959 RepID=UPI002E0DB94C|nr:type VII secretion protein EccB [Dactylosporangium sp. NBC_01737]